jgi:phenylacetate-CoA ligase
MLTWLSKHIFFPLWEFKDGARRGEHLRLLNESQWWGHERLRAQQWDRVREIVAYATRHCPYYEKRLAEVGVSANLRDWDDFRRIPVLTKQDIREQGLGLLSKEFAREDLVESRTGGSTGKALTLYCDKQCQELRNAAAMRSDQWAGWDIGMKVAAVWGNPPVADTVKKKLRNLLLDRFMYLDTMQIDETSVMRFVREWRREKPKVLFGHSHSLFILATFLRKLDIHDLQPQGIISTSMMLLDSERRVIEEVFRCKVTNRYGCEEVSLIACQCEKGDGLHLNLDHVLVEFLRDDGTQAASGEEANIIVTELVNRGMPLIRYQVEDLGVPGTRNCACGRRLPIMERVVGRRADFLKRPDGSLVAGVSLVERTLTAIPGIEQMQLIQDSANEIQAKLVTDGQWTQSSEAALRQELHSVFGGQVAIDIARVAKLDQTVAGKFRFAICNI